MDGRVWAHKSLVLPEKKNKKKREIVVYIHSRPDSDRNEDTTMLKKDSSVKKTSCDISHRQKISESSFGREASAFSVGKWIKGGLIDQVRTEQTHRTKLKLYLPGNVSGTI